MNATGHGPPVACGSLEGDGMARAEGGTTSNPQPHDDPARLAALRADFPGYRIWREIGAHRIRYIARRLDYGPGLHTLVTAGLDEMRDVLADEMGHPPRPPGAAGCGPSPACTPLGPRGNDHHAAGREAARKILAGFPKSVTSPALTACLSSGRSPTWQARHPPIPRPRLMPASMACRS